VSPGPEVEIEGRRLRLSNLEKVLYPEAGFTKGQVIDYYTRVAPALLPHLRERPITLNRYPDGVEGKSFYEKQCPSHRPDWVRTTTVASRRSASGVIRYCLVEDVPTLVWLANLAALELHPLLARAGDTSAATLLVFDLDPGPPADVVSCARVGLRLRRLLGDLGLECFAKTSGSKGLQVYAPLGMPTSYRETKPFSHAVAQLLERDRPDEITSRMDKSLRPGKVFIDWSQNDEHKSTVSVYSMRARARPTVSTPVTWEEVEAAADAGDAGVLTFEAPAVVDRVARRGDLFTAVAELEQRLPALAGPGR
jgi:bifunctional non-homologous end joining protein LigD